MSMTSHLETLEDKHAFFEHMIEEETSRPLPDHMYLNHLKKQKLVVKEEIHHLTHLPEAA